MSTLFNLEPLYLIEGFKTISGSTFSVGFYKPSKGRWAPTSAEADRLPISDLRPFADPKIMEAGIRLSVGLVLESGKILWLPHGPNNWFLITLSDGQEEMPYAPSSDLALLQMLPKDRLLHSGRLIKLPAGPYSVLVGDETWPPHSYYKMRTTRHYADLIAELVGGIVQEPKPCSTHC